MIGKVYLVGAGPGDPDLLTVKAHRLLQNADVVLHDALVTDEILGLIRSGAQVIDIGKRRGQKLLTQDEINRLLIAYAGTHPIVVRLKGGDPTIFGRAGEEIAALYTAGIQFEIVPGITSALAGAAAAGISLTDRRFASSVVFATAHLKSEESADWKKLVASGSTLAIYMPGQDYQALAVQLHEAGIEFETPCVVVSSAYRPQQQILWTNLHALLRSPALPAPSLVIVGDCAAAIPLIQPTTQQQLRYTIDSAIALKGTFHE
jgi:uroporphyrin-III C-methyltransferase